MWQLGTALAILALIGVDQATKWLADTYFRTSIPLWENVFELTYVENRGAAWGIGQGGRWIFVAVTAVVMLVVLWLLFSGWLRRRHSLLAVVGILIAAGGIGNMIDRVCNGYVIDFLYVKCIDFPVFNVADCCVVIGAGLLILWILFLYKEPSATVKEDTDGTGGTDGDAATGQPTHRQGDRTDVECDASNGTEMADAEFGDGQRKAADETLSSDGT